jgi:hypothetical protein
MVMLLPRAGDKYPTSGVHADHVAIIVGVDMHGIPSWEDPTIPPRLAISCSCGTRWDVDLYEAVISAA